MNMPSPASAEEIQEIAVAPPPTLHPQPNLSKQPAKPALTPPAPGTSSVMNIELLVDVPVQITVELGRTQMTVRQVLELERGSVIELERVAGDPVDVLVNGSLIAVGEVVVVDDRFGVRISHIVSTNAQSGVK
jgi:flagellar motor switch protein FliN/FliY